MRRIGMIILGLLLTTLLVRLGSGALKAEPAKVTDLLAALEASLERAKKGGGPAKKTAGTRKKAAARKATGKRTASRKSSARSRKTA